MHPRGFKNIQKPIQQSGPTAPTAAQDAGAKRSRTQAYPNALRNPIISAGVDFINHKVQKCNQHIAIYGLRFLQDLGNQHVPNLSYGFCIHEF